MIRARGLGVGYPGRPPLFGGVDLEVAAGQVLCLLGPNGVGKSSLLKSLAGLLAPLGGVVELDGQDLARLSRSRVAAGLSYVPQFHTPVFAFSALEVVLMGRAPHLGVFAAPGPADIRAAREAMEALGVDHLAQRPYTELSGGERQMVVFARVLCQGARTLLLDEPTSHLDFGNQARVLGLVRQLAARGYAIVMTSHFPDHAYMVAHQVGLLERGGVVELGAPERVVTQENLARAYGVQVRLVSLADGDTLCAPVLPEDILAVERP